MRDYNMCIDNVRQSIHCIDARAPRKMISVIDGFPNVVLLADSHRSDKKRTRLPMKTMIMCRNT